MNDYTIDKEIYTTDEFVEYLKENPGKKVKFAHTDKYNKVLTYREGDFYILVFDKVGKYIDTIKVTNEEEAKFLLLPTVHAL